MSSLQSATPIAILASGRGSNFEAIHGAIQAGKLAARIVAVVSDRSDAAVLDKARAAGIPAMAVTVPAAPTDANASVEEQRLHRRIKHEEAILAALAPYSPHFLVLAGFMRVLTPRLLEAFRSPRGYTRIVNVHPSLLPSFPGVHSYAQAFDYGVKVTGVTVHLVELEVDAGPICAQESFKIDDCHDVGEVETRGLAVEHRLFPQALNWILTEGFAFEGALPSAATEVARSGQHAGRAKVTWRPPTHISRSEETV